ncbi:MAG: hypothetical protein DMF89_04845 [Acidobacteria bacterium]|nr:MAG: hypothetical protein DMF89_04845 [Acidobacteriota bacterium]
MGGAAPLTVSLRFTSRVAVVVFAVIRSRRASSKRTPEAEEMVGIRGSSRAKSRSLVCLRRCQSKGVNMSVFGAHTLGSQRMWSAQSRADSHRTTRD